MTRQLHIGLSLSPTWLRGAAWREPSSNVENMLDLDFNIALARRAEQAKLDFLFKPDSLFIDTKGLDNAPGMTSLDPIILLAGIAAATSHIGLVATASTTFNPPYVVARQIQSLHWLSKGRAGWNIVTSLDGQRNFGAETMPSADWRYERAAEFTDLVRKLWDSYPVNAMLLNRETGQFADNAQIKPVNHHGKHFSVDGPLTMPGHPAGPPVLFQAGASPTGRDFAAAHASGIFASAPDMAASTELRLDLRRRARAAGRNENQIKIMPGFGFTLAKSRAEARDIAHARQSPQSIEQRYRFIEDSLGLDLRDLPHDAPIPQGLMTGIRPEARSRTHAELLLRLINAENPPIADLLKRPESSGSGHWRVIGTPADAVHAIVTWFEAEAMDGIIALPGTLTSLDLFCDEVIPALVERGLFRTDYQGASLAAHMGIAQAH